MSNIQFVVRGVQVDEIDGLLSLNIIYQVAGEPENQDPRQWNRLPETQRLINMVATELNVGKSHIMKTQRGKGGGTKAHWKLALAYAAYLDATLYSEILETYKRVKSGDPELAKEIIWRTSSPEALKEIGKTVQERGQYLDSFWGVHGQLKGHDANLPFQHASYNKHVNELAGVPKGHRGVMSREQQLKMRIAQDSAELTLMHDDTSSGWKAVNVAKDASSRVIKVLRPSND